MADKAFGDFFLSDSDDELLEEDDDLIVPPVVVPVQAAAATPQPPAVSPQPAQPSEQVAYAPPAAQPAPQPEAPEPPQAPVTPRPAASARQPSREERLADALNRLMEESLEIEAAALVSLDGFIMASALPEGMHEDKVGAMSAAILGLGERAAVELGRGALSQVFIEGEDGYVLLIAAGDRAVLTALAGAEAKLGLVLYDMRSAAESIGEILG